MAEERNLALARASEPLEDEEATKADLQRRMEETRESISQTVTEIKETVMNQYQQVKESISDTLDWREQYRRRPVPFTVGAFGVGIIVGYSVANALSSDDQELEYDEDAEIDRIEGFDRSPVEPRSYAQPILGMSGGPSESRADSRPQAAPTYAVYEDSTRPTTAEEEESKGPGLIARFKDTRAYDRLQDELSTLGSRVVDELSKTAQSVVIPALLLKLKDLIGIDLSTQREFTQRSKLEHDASASSKEASETSKSPASEGSSGAKKSAASAASGTGQREVVTGF